MSEGEQKSQEQQEGELGSQDHPIGGQLFEEHASRSHNLCLAIFLTLMMVALCLIYGFLIIVPAHPVNSASIVTAIALALLTVPGFGLIFGYTKRLVWSGMGFNLFILALSLVLYPLINDFWSRTGLQNNSPALNFNYDNRYYTFYLTNRDNTPGGTSSQYGNTITNAIKCALSLSAAFSAVLGRAGQLECFIMTVVGVVGFELNRQLVQERVGADSFGSAFIFGFGGWMGLSMGFFCYLRQLKEDYKIQLTSLRKYSSCPESLLYSLLGALFVFVFLPFLAFDIDSYIYHDSTTPYTAPALLLLAMGAGLVGALCYSALHNGAVILRDLTHGMVAGAIAAGMGTLYVSFPGLAMIAGFTGGLVQALIQNRVQRWGIRVGRILSTVSWSLFGVQGFIGGCFAAGWKKLSVQKYSSQFGNNVLFNFAAQNELFSVLISMGLGLGFGALAGFIAYCTNTQPGSQLFDDSYYWRNSDGIRPLASKDTKSKKAGPYVPDPQPKPMSREDGSGPSVSKGREQVNLGVYGVSGVEPVQGSIANVVVSEYQQSEYYQFEEGGDAYRFNHAYL